MTKLLDRFLQWHARHRRAVHNRRLRKMRVVSCAPNPRCIVRNLREPN